MSRRFEKISGCDAAIIPIRSTECSAGYDFYALEDTWVNPLGSDGAFKATCIRTGIKAYMECDEYLQLSLRSSIAMCEGLICANGVGIIDADYVDNESNEGDIGFLVHNLTDKPKLIESGTKIGQGVFLRYLRVDDDSAGGIRIGGFGSTGTR